MDSISSADIMMLQSILKIGFANIKHVEKNFSNERGSNEYQAASLVEGRSLSR